MYVYMYNLTYTYIYMYYVYVYGGSQSSTVFMVHHLHRYVDI